MVRKKKETTEWRGAITLLVKSATNLDVRGVKTGLGEWSRMPSDIIRYDRLSVSHSFIPSAADVAEADKQLFVVRWLHQINPPTSTSQSSPQYI